jgi:putative NADPH-quinone reductase
MFGDHAIHGSIEDLLLPIQRGTLAYAGFDVLPPFTAYHVPIFLMKHVNKSCLIISNIYIT